MLMSIPARSNMPTFGAKIILHVAHDNRCLGSINADGHCHGLLTITADLCIERDNAAPPAGTEMSCPLGLVDC